MRKNLVVARVGGNSLHRRWVDPHSPRNWDLYLSPYQEIAGLSDIDCFAGDVLAGPKWTGLRRLLNEWQGWRDYEQIWLPDDDIDTSQEVINAIFDVAGSVGLQLFAPALDKTSYYAHYITMQNTSFYGRWVGFVEIMVPGLSRAALELLLPTLNLTDTGWGWGLDSVWPYLLDYKDIGIIDGLAVSHTRPIGQMRDSELGKRLLDESDKVLSAYNCHQVHTTFGAFDANLERLDITPERLLAEVVKGSQYLIDKDPRVLAWIADFHQQHFDVAPYPIEGTPTP